MFFAHACSSRARGEEAREGFDFADAVGFVGDGFAVEDVRRAQGELEPADAEADEKGRARELFGGLERLLSLAAQGRDDDFAGESAEVDLARVVDEGHPFAVAHRPFRHVRQNVLPPIAEILHQRVQGGQVGVDFLHGDEVEVRDDFGGIEDRFAVAAAVLR
jgi:hypothetical protein